MRVLISLLLVCYFYILAPYSPPLQDASFKFPVVEKILSETFIEGDVVPVSFEFENATSRPLKIVKVSDACNCASSTILVGGVKRYGVGAPIFPGERGTITINIRTKGFDGDRIVSSTIWSVWGDINSNGEQANQPIQQKLIVRLRVKRTYTWSDHRNMVSPLNVHTRMGFTQEFTLARFDNKKFEIVGFTNDTDYLTCDARAANEQKSEWIVNVKILPNAPLGLLAKRIKVVTYPPIPDAATPPAIEIRTRVVGEVTMDPDCGVHFGIVRKVPQTRVIHLLTVDPKHRLVLSNLTFQATNKNAASSIGPTVSTTSVGDSVEIGITVGETMRPGPFSGIVSFDTGVVGGPEKLSFPVSGYVK
ncbi:MAG: hypothetical protein ACKVS6_04785 [Planctomycetota bacterium]